jgi:predicted naringenin-chalcone synthase
MVALAVAPVLTRFAVTRPRYETAQARSLEWLAAVHTEAEAVSAGLDDAARARFHQRIAAAIERCACGPDRIATRGHSLGELDGFRFHGRALGDVHTDPHGHGSGARMQRYVELVDAYFETQYADTADATPPDDVIHVTCTGYAAPNGAQKLVARRGWGAATRVTAAYHMGCYAALPALRIAAGFLAAGSRHVELAHTELCSLHLDPTDHALDQLVVQSLFADGLIRYALVPGSTSGRGGLGVLALHEQVLPDCADAMTWIVGDHGMQMTLARDVPERIAGALREFVLLLLRRAGRDVRALRDAVVAVHPGGPRIIDRVRDVLELDDAQVAASRGVLRDHGNMSSATLPHVWARLLDDPTVAPGTLIPCLAFGPGLTLCGAVLEKR